MDFDQLRICSGVLNCALALRALALDLLLLGSDMSAVLNGVPRLLISKVLVIPAFL
jgi:hypothetical protein